MDAKKLDHSDPLVPVMWLKDHQGDPSIQVIEAVWGKGNYPAGHIPGAIAWEFVDDLGGTTNRPDLANQEEIENLLSRSGINQDTTVVVYSGISNLLATFTFWVLKMYGHPDIRLLDGGRQKWVDEGYPLTGEIPSVTPTKYKAQPRNVAYRATKDNVLDAIQKGNVRIIDARPVGMYRGEDGAGTKRAGRIPGAVNLPAIMEKNEDGTFKAWATPFTQKDGTLRSTQELQTLMEKNSISPNQQIITYCVAGGLSTMAWFALTQILRYQNVREYERSWQEWGNQEDLPIEC